jgi:hypothetical protein
MFLTAEPRLYAIPWQSLAGWQYLFRIINSAGNNWDMYVDICPGIYEDQQTSMISDQNAYMKPCRLRMKWKNGDIPANYNWEDYVYGCPNDWHDAHNILAKYTTAMPFTDQVGFMLEVP